MIHIKNWIICILIGAFIVNIVDMVLPESKLKPYINLVCNFIFIFIVISPIVGFFSSDKSFEDKLLKSMNNYNEKYVETNKDLADGNNNFDLNKEYQNNLKTVLQLKLDEYGYELEDIDFNGKILDIKDCSKEKNNCHEILQKEQYINQFDKVVESSKRQFKGLKEWNFGIYEGESDDLDPPFPFGNFFKKFGGESENEVSERVSTTVLELMKNTDQETVLIVSHGLSCYCFAKRWEQNQQVSLPNDMPNCVVLKYQFNDEQFSLVEVIDVTSELK